MGGGSGPIMKYQSVARVAILSRGEECPANFSFLFTNKSRTIVAI